MTSFPVANSGFLFLVGVLLLVFICDAPSGVMGQDPAPEGYWPEPLNPDTSEDFDNNGGCHIW